MCYNRVDEYPIGRCILSVSDKIRILIAEETTLFRQGLQRLLRDQEDMECIGNASDGEDAIRLAKELSPDVVVMGIVMPKINGIDAAGQIKEACPNTAVILLTRYADHRYVLSSIAVGIDGYIMKQRELCELVEAIRLVHRGMRVFDSRLMNGEIRNVATEYINRRPTFNSLRPREVEVLNLAAQGMSNKQIANKLGVTTHTISTHFVHILNRLGVQSRTEAVLYALHKGWISLNEFDKGR